MTRTQFTIFLGTLALSLPAACGGEGNVPPDATPVILDAPPPPVDADVTTCVGRPDGSPCGDPTETECDGADYCLSGFCFSNYQSAGRMCGDDTDNTCNRRDTCDGFGNCVANIAVASFPCGDATDDECTAPDSCDGQGSCLSNDRSDGTPCGATDDTTCTNPDSCLAGMCMSNDEPEQSACDDCPLGVGECAGCVTGICLNVCGGPHGLLTQTNGTYQYDGYMFDIRALETVRIESLEAILDPGLHDVEIYYIPNSYMGFEAMSFAWTLIGGSPVLYNDEPLPTPIPIPVDVEIPAGETYAFYITTKGTDMFGSLGSGEGSVFTSDSNIEILVGTGNYYPFSTTVLRPRVWNGRVNYVTNPPCVVSP